MEEAGGGDGHQAATAAGTRDTALEHLLPPNTRKHLHVTCSAHHHTDFGTLDSTHPLSFPRTASSPTNAAAPQTGRDAWAVMSSSVPPTLEVEGYTDGVGGAGM